MGERFQPSGRCLSCPSPEIKKELGQGQDGLVSEGQGLKGSERPEGASHVPFPGAPAPAPQELLWFWVISGRSTSLQARSPQATGVLCHLFTWGSVQGEASVLGILAGVLAA